MRKAMARQGGDLSEDNDFPLDVIGVFQLPGESFWS
jgi:hypothetical protein